MIQLVAADLDGTLLDRRKQLSPDLFALIRTLRARGIRFAAASGRQYHNLTKLFAPLKDEMLFIAENGAVVYDGQTCLFSDELPKEYFVAPILQVQKMPGVSCVLCAQDSAYIAHTEDRIFVENAQMYYENLTIVEDLLETLEEVSAFKLAVFAQGRAETDCWPVMQAYTDPFAVMLSGADWVDLMNPQTNKGTALARLAQTMDIALADTMAFGDYLNDIELLQAAGVSYCMENGHPELKRIADRIAPSNDANGVVRAIQAYFDLKIENG